MLSPFLHESANELVASHSFVVGCFACLFCFLCCFWFLFVCLLCVFWLLMMTAYWTCTGPSLVLFCGSQSRWPRACCLPLVPVRSLTFSARFAACVCFGVVCCPLFWPLVVVVGLFLSDVFGFLGCACCQLTR